MADRSGAAEAHAWLSRIAEINAGCTEGIRSVLNSDAVPSRPSGSATSQPSTCRTTAVWWSTPAWRHVDGRLFDLRSPNQSYMRSAGHLGWAFSAGLGAKAPVRTGQLVAFTGDAGSGTNRRDRDGVRWNLNSVTIVNNNHSGKPVERGFDRAYGGKQHRATGTVDLPQTNFAKIAEDIGAVGIRVEKPGDIGGAIDKALSVKGPVIVDVTTDSRRWRAGGDRVATI